MTEDHDEPHNEPDRPEYDPESPAPPDKEPPYRRTAPQDDYTMGQVAFGFVVLLIGLLVTFGLPLVLT